METGQTNSREPNQKRGDQIGAATMTIFDFMKPNPYVRRWMEPYLPNSPYWRDVLVAIAGLAIFTSVAMLAAVILPKPVAFPVGAGFLGVGCALFPGEAHGRWTTAATEYRMTKRNAKNGLHSTEDIFSCASQVPTRRHAFPAELKQENEKLCNKATSPDCKQSF